MSRDPSHPWVGESVALDWANPVSGVLADDGIRMRWRHRAAFPSSESVAQDVTPLSATPSPESFIAGFTGSEMLLSGDAVEAAFVVVCSGNGTLRLSGGVDPDWTLDDPADASVPFGDFTVTPTDGTVELVGTFPSFDVDAYLADAHYVIGMVECIAGTVSIDQVRLRLWPPGGPLGGWATMPDPHTEVVAVERRLVTQVDGPGDLGGFAVDTGQIIRGAADTAWDETGLDLELILQPETHRHVIFDGSITLDAFAATQASHSVSETLEGGEFPAIAAGSMSGTLVMQPDPAAIMRLSALGYLPGVYGLDFVHAPDEVPGDMPVRVLDAPTTAWDDDAAITTSTFTPLADGPGLGTYWHITAWPDLQWFDPDDVVLPLPSSLTPEIPDLDSSTGVTMPEGRLALFSLSHDSFKPKGIPDPYLGVAGSYVRGVTAIVGLDIGPSTVTIPAFQYWSPSGPGRVPPLRQRNRGRVRQRLRAARQDSPRQRGFL